MLTFLITSVVNAFGLYIATSLIPQVSLTPYGGDGNWETVATFLAVGTIFGLVNAIVSPVIKIIAFPLYIITFGLISFVINGALLLFVAWLSTQLGAEVFQIDGFTAEGLTIDSLGWAILAALVMSVAAFFARLLLRVLKIR